MEMVQSLYMYILVQVEVQEHIACMCCVGKKKLF